jgi:hypothetical protein
MLNFTLTITAAPELLAAISAFTNSITSAKVVTEPQADQKFTSLKEQLKQFDAEAAYTQSASNSNMHGAQESAVQQMILVQQPVLNPVPVNINPTYSQGITAPASSPNSVPVNMVQVPQQAAVQAPAVQTSTVPTTSHTYAMEQLAVAATQLVDAGRRSELVSLLQTFGVQALTALPKDQYGAFATQLRVLGAKI